MHHQHMHCDLELQFAAQAHRTGCYSRCECSTQLPDVVGDGSIFTAIRDTVQGIGVRVEDSPAFNETGNNSIVGRLVGGKGAAAHNAGRLIPPHTHSTHCYSPVTCSCSGRRKRKDTSMLVTAMHPQRVLNNTALLGTVCSGSCCSLAHADCLPMLAEPAQS